MQPFNIATAFLRTTSPKKAICYLFLYLSAFLPNSASAIEVVDHNSETVPDVGLWDVVDIRFRVKNLPQQPVDVAFSATFFSESGDRHQVPGFYNGGSEFLLRFTPPSTGQWTYSTSSERNDLNEKSGRLSVSPARAGRRGGVVRDSDHNRRFCYQNGDNYYPIAFECDWLFALDAGNDSDIPVTRTFVDQLADNGFNQVVMNVFAYDVTWQKDPGLDPQYDYGSPDTFPFGGTNAAPDHSQLNIEYFRRLDRVIDYLDQRQIVAHLMIYVWNKRVNWPDADSDEDNRYFDYVVRRYQAFPNLVWDISKEALGYGHTDVNYITQRIERLRKLDQYHRLITVHDYSYCRRFIQKIDFVSVQLWSSELYGVMRKVCLDMPGKPILNIEHGGYEKGPYVVFTGNYTSPEVCLERAYQCLFAGTFPTHYWQGAAWNVIIPDIGRLPETGRPRFEYYRHMREFVKQLNVGELTAGQKKSNSGFCLHNGSDLYLYYVPKENVSIGLRLPKELRGRSMTGRWFDPFTGTYSDVIHQKVSQWPAFDTPNDGLRILIVKILPAARS